MPSGYKELDDDADVDGERVEASGPTLVFGSVDEFVREYLSLEYRRVVGPSNRAPRRWPARWWQSPEAISRLEALKPGEPLPYEAPPAGMFPDVRGHPA